MGISNDPKYKSTSGEIGAAAVKQALLFVRKKQQQQNKITFDNLINNMNING
jgi:hypothetical protein